MTLRQGEVSIPSADTVDPLIKPWTMIVKEKGGRKVWVIRMLSCIERECYRFINFIGMI